MFLVKLFTAGIPGIPGIGYHLDFSPGAKEDFEPSQATCFSNQHD